MDIGWHSVEIKQREAWTHGAMESVAVNLNVQFSVEFYFNISCWITLYERQLT